MDVVTAATPLTYMKAGDLAGLQSVYDLKAMFIGNIGGCGADAEDHLAPLGDGRGGVVGGHEERAQHEAAAEDAVEHPVQAAPGLGEQEGEDKSDKKEGAAK